MQYKCIVYAQFVHGIPNFVCHQKAVHNGNMQKLYTVSLEQGVIQGVIQPLCNGQINILIISTSTYRHTDYIYTSILYNAYCI